METLYCVLNAFYLIKMVLYISLVGERHLSDVEIHDRDLDWLLQSDGIYVFTCTWCCYITLGHTYA